jgi:metal-responsive CopG/Arc/MetJ family transcriptional regulator
MDAPLNREFSLALRTSSSHVIIMRTIVDLPPEQIAALDAYTKAEGISRAEAVRRAVAAFVPAAQKKGSLRDHPAVGTITMEEKDSVAYVRKLRAEWNHRP